MQADEASSSRYIQSAEQSNHDKYERNLNDLLGKLYSIDLSSDIFDESPHIHGRGGFGDVFKGKSRRHGDIAVAVKRLRFYMFPENRDCTKLILRELRIWSSVQHANVLPLLGYVMHGRFPALVSPWMAKGSVRRFMDVNPDKAMAHLAKKISSGLLYLHEQGIIHSDLKCDNVLLSDFDEPLLADFGISRCITSFSISNNSTNPKGSARWMAREFFTSGLYETDAAVEHSKETDVWAFGMVLYELLSNHVPFSHLKADVQVSLALVQGLTPSKPISVCKEEDQQLLWPIAQDCWQEVASERPGMHTIFNKLHGLNDRRRTVELPNLSPPSPAADLAPRQDATEFAGPSNKVALHPVLRRGTPEFASLKYDLRFPWAVLVHEVPENVSREPACLPKRRALFINAPFVYPPDHPNPGGTNFKVYPGNGSQHVRVIDVLETLHREFHAIPSRDAWESVKTHDPKLRKSIVGAYESRCAARAMWTAASVDDEKQKGLMCLDWFGPKTFFGGLSPTEMEFGDWDVVTVTQGSLANNPWRTHH